MNVQRLPLGKLFIYDIITAAGTADDDFNYSELSEDNNSIFLSTLISGEVKVAHGDRGFMLFPGELAILSRAQDSRVTFQKDSRYITLQISEELFFERLVGRNAEVFEPKKLDSTGLVPVIANLLKSLTLEVKKMSETDQYTLTNTLLELTWASLRAATVQPESHQHDSQNKLLGRILAYMEQHYSDCQLTPKTVAVANGISIRYLHRLFQQSGMAVGKWIWERRLKAAREDIIDPEKVTMLISEIAFIHGFNDPAHFSRSFRERFNISPRKLRCKACKENKLSGLEI